MAATGYILFLLLFLTSSLHSQARQPNFLHKVINFNVATEDRQLSIPKQEDPMTSASQNRNKDGRLPVYDPEKNSRASTIYNADAYELYDEDPAKESPIGTNYSTDDFEPYHEGTEKKPYTSPYYQTKETATSYPSNEYTKKQYGMRDTRFWENGHHFYVINADSSYSNGYSALGGSRGGYGSTSTQVDRKKQNSFGGNGNAFEYSNAMERYQGEPRDEFMP